MSNINRYQVIISFVLDCYIVKIVNFVNYFSTKNSFYVFWNNIFRRVVLTVSSSASMKDD